MQVHRSIHSLPLFKNAIITIGTFDGVHSGHQKIIDALLKEAKANNGESVIITFHPHPRKIINHSASLSLINTLEEKIGLLRSKGIDHLVIVPFTKGFSELNADEYIDQFLIQKFHPHTIIIGYDHRFGKERKGDYKLLEEKREIFNYNLIEIPKYLVDEIGISSTKIRNAILSGEIETANKLLGYKFFFSGRVIEGDKIGRTLGYPTANLIYTDEDKIKLSEGVYAVYVEVNGSEKKGMLSIGKRPTLNDTIERVEVNIFDFNEDIYGKEIKVILTKYLRPQEKYTSLEELKNQLHLDKEASLQHL